MKAKYIVNTIALITGIGAGMYFSNELGLLNDINETVSDGIDSVLNNVGSQNTVPEETSSLNNDIVLVQSIYNDFVIDLKYATKDNITQSILYDTDLCYLQRSTLNKLIQVNEELKGSGYRLKIWDAYRPLYIHKKIWAKFPNASYEENPFNSEPSVSKGTSVSVTLTDIQGNEVSMPTGFDKFSLLASRNSTKWSKEDRKRVKLLTDVMLKYGFVSRDSTWWTFDDEDADDFPVLDITFRDLLKK